MKHFNSVLTLCVSGVCGLLLTGMASAAITFEFDFADLTNGLNKGFNDPAIVPGTTNTYGQVRRETTQRASRLLGSFYNNTATVQVQVTSTAIPGNLGACGSEATGGESPGFVRSVMAKKVIEGIDENGSAPDAELSMNFESASSPSWDYTDSCPEDKVDYVDTLVHELTHALGFLNAVGPGGGGLLNLGAGLPNKWYAWDRILCDSSTNFLVSSSYVFNMDYIATLTNGMMCIWGTNTLSANNGQLARIFAPTPWSSGSSASHVNTNYPEKTVMYWIGGSGSGGRIYSPVESGVMTDLGYDIIDPSGPSNVTVTAGTYANKVRLTWMAPTYSPALSNVLGYAICRGTSQNPYASSVIADNVTALSYEDTTVTSGTVYYYWVRAHYNNLVAQTSVMRRPVSGYAGVVAGTALAADFDGDRRADPTSATSTGVWTIKASQQNYNTDGPVALGGSGSPAAGDFDGDRRADIAMVDASGAWTLMLSSASYQPSGPYSLTPSGGTPFLADFDADSRADPALFTADGWYIWFSSQNYARSGPHLPVPAGISVTPFPADFDADGRADPAVYTVSGWYIWLSSQGYVVSGPYLPIPAGQSGTMLAADIDGDGHADPVLVTSGGLWTIWMSSLSYSMQGPYPLGIP